MRIEYHARPFQEGPFTIYHYRFRCAGACISEGRAPRRPYPMRLKLIVAWDLFQHLIFDFNQLPTFIGAILYDQHIKPWFW